MLLPMLFTVSLKSQVVNCNIFNYSNPGSCHTASIECVMIIDQAFVDANEGDIMLARLDAERVFDSIKLRMTPLLTSQGYATTFRLVHFPDIVAPNNWYNGSSAYWIGKVSEYWNTNPKKCIKRDVIIILSGQEPPFHGVSNGISICNPEIPNANKVCIIRKDGMEAKALGHELMHNFGLQHLDEDPNCDHFCYDSGPYMKDPLMCSAGTGDWHFTSCDRSCLSTFFDASKCACLQIVHPGFASDFTCPTTASIGFSVVADNPNPVLNCKMGGDTVTLTITLVNDSTTTNRNIRAFVNTTDNAFVEFVPDPSTNFNCVVPIPGSRTEFRITNTVNTACSDETSFSLIPGETKTVTLKFRYKGGITFQQGNIGTNSFRIFVYTGMIHNANNSISIYPFVEKSGGTTNIWDSSNPVLVNGQLTLNTGLPIVLGLNNNNTPNNENNKILFTAGSSIEINSQNSLKLVHAQIEGCDNMWKGITVKQGGTLEMNTMTSVKDGQYAINVQKGGTLKATDCMFFNNNYSIRTAPEGSGGYNITLIGNQYGTDENGLKSVYSGQLPAPFENRGYAGVYLVGAGSLVLQSSSAQTDNKFFSLHHGIIAENTNLTIKNSTFENIEKLPGVPGLNAFALPGKAIYVSGGSLNVTGDGILADDLITFNNCHTAIEGFHASLTVSQNKMQSVNNGILSRIGIIKNVSVTFNDIQAKDCGIGVYHSSALANGCLVNNNVVTMSGNSQGVGIGTGGSGDFAQSGGVFSTNNVTVSEGMAGFNIGVSRNLKVTQNTVSTESSSTKFGIGISGGDINTINCNNISGSGEKGIYGLKAGRSAFICNSTLNTGLGLNFDGVFIGKGTIPVAGNTMTNNATGGLLMGGDAVIGEQVHRGNKWTGGVTFAEHLGGFLIASKSLFTIDANEASSFLPTVALPLGWFIDESTSSPSYQCIPGTSCPLIAASSDAIRDKEIAKGELIGLTNQAAQLWLAQRRLYEKLTEEGNPYTGDSDVNTFLSQAQSNGLSGYGNLQKNLRLMFNLNANDISDLASYESQIDQKMNQLAETELDLNAFGINQTDSTNLTNLRNTILQALATITAQRESKLSNISSTRSTLASALTTQNNVLTGTAEYLLNEKTVNSIFLETIATGNNSFSESQLSSLESIAGQCALSGGESVLRARDMLALVQETAYFYDDDILCNAQPRTSKGSVGGFEDAIKIFPNPANDEIRIQYDVQKTDGAHLKFFNVYGQLSKVVLLPEARGTVLTPTNNLASGVYFYTLDGVTAGRVIINH